MGRPLLNDDDKRKQVAVRFGPEAREALREAADSNGRSLGAEIEARVLASLKYDAPTGELIENLVSEIAALQSVTRKRWFADMTTWAACAEMFARGPIRRARPERDKPLNDEVVRDSLDQLGLIWSNKREIAQTLADIGVRVGLQPKPAGDLGGMLGSRLAAAGGTRRLERASCEAIEDQDIRAKVLKLHDEMMALDAQEEIATERYRAAMQPYRDAEARGRAIYRARQQEIAASLRDSGDFQGYLEELI